MVLVVFTSLKLLGSSRLGSCIRTAAFQGVLLGFLPIIAHPGSLAPRLLFMAAAAIGLKGIVFPWLLFRALRGARVRREGEPVVEIGRAACREEGRSRGGPDHLKKKKDRWGGGGMCE